MKLIYTPLLAVHHIGFLPHRLFNLISFCVAVEVLYFHQNLEQTSTKQKSCKKSSKIVLVTTVDDSWENYVLHQWL